MRLHIFILCCYFAVVRANFMYMMRATPYVSSRQYSNPVSNGLVYESHRDIPAKFQRWGDRWCSNKDGKCFCGYRTLIERSSGNTKTVMEFCKQYQECIPSVYKTIKNIGVFGNDNNVEFYTSTPISSESEIFRNPTCLRTRDALTLRCSNRNGLYRNLGLCKCYDGREIIYILNGYCNERLGLTSAEPISNCQYTKGKTQNDLFGEFCMCGRLESRCTWSEYCHASFKKCSQTKISDLTLGQCQKDGRHKTGSLTQLCKCSNAEYCDGRDYCLVDGTCSVISQPECPNKDGTEYYDGDWSRPVCICGSGSNQKKVSRNQYCDTSMPKNYNSAGPYFKTCDKTNPYKPVEGMCTCGTDSGDEIIGPTYNTCRRGEFCRNSGQCYAAPPDCPNKDGTIQLDLIVSERTSCKCGRTTNTGHGNYCNAGMNLVSSAPIPTCERHHDKQPQACACGSTQCSENQYCNFKLQRCDNIHNQQCSSILGQKRNENTCICGSETCAAPGQFCDCGVLSPQCNANTQATCSPYKQCSNVLGDAANEHTCQCGTVTCGRNEFCNRDKALCSTTPNAICEHSLDSLETSCYCEPEGDMCPQGKTCHPSDGCIDTAAVCDGRQACNCEGTICKAGEFCGEDKICTPYDTTTNIIYRTIKQTSCENHNHYSIYGKTECERAVQHYKNLTDIIVLEKESEFRTFHARHSGQETYYRDIRYPKGCTWLYLQEYANSHSPNSNTPCSGALECLCALPNCKAEDVDIVNYKCACHGETCTSDNGLYCYTLNTNVDASCQQYPQCAKDQKASEPCMCSQGRECEAGQYCKRNGLCDTTIPCAQNTSLTESCVCGNHDCPSGQYCIGNVCSPTDTLAATCTNETTTNCVCGDKVCTSSQSCLDNDCVTILHFDAKNWIPKGSGEGGEYCVSHRLLPPSELCETNKIINNTCNCGNYSGAPNELCKDNKIYRALNLSGIINN